MKKILVISDTHYPIRKIPKLLYKIVEDMDALIHCGDLQEIDFLEELEFLDIPAYPVLGNNYDYLLKEKIPRQRIITFEDVRIGIVHGNGSLPIAIENARKEFMNEKLDLVCYGHSHIASTKIIGGCIYFNPGSMTCSRSGPESYGILEISGNKVKTKIIDIEEDA